jgi:hypothetical protein
MTGARRTARCFGALPQGPRSFVAPFFLRRGGYEKIIGRRCAPIMPDERRSADGVFPGECDWGTGGLFFKINVGRGGRMPNAECRMPNAECRMPLAVRQQPTADSRQPTANSRQPTADSRQPTADSRQPTADSQQPTADSRQPTADSQQPTANSRQRTTAIMSA